MPSFFSVIMSLIDQYLAERQALKGTQDQSVEARRCELVAVEKILADHGGSLDTITTAQALTVVAQIRSNDFSRNYTHKCIQTFKSFLLWHAENNGADLNEKKIRQIKTPGMDWRTKRPEDLLTRDDIMAIIDACSNTRDRAIIATLYDGSFRPGEIVGMTWGDLIRDEYGTRMVFKTPKTGYERPIRFVFADPYIRAWENDYPLTPIVSASPLFTQTVLHSKQYMPLTFGGLAKLIRRLKKKTGISKLSPSIFRPSKITHDVEEGKDLQYIMIKNWGSLKTDMIDVYARPSHEYVDRIALESAGITKIQQRKKPPTLLSPTVCPECGTLNPASAKYCMMCTTGLTEETRDTQAVLARKHVDDIDIYLPILEDLRKAKERGVDLSAITSGGTGTSPTRDTQDPDT